MCGIAGIVGRDSGSRAALGAMARAIVHRGPDDDGLWQDRDSPVGFAFRRLAIVDLSPAGRQPMDSADGRWTIAFNGEIYNHRDLRRDIDADAGAASAIAWRGHSDTETLVEGIARWGLTATIERAVGMFAIALWNRDTRQLSLIRDRFGEKPLYYGWAAGNFVFASELKAIRALDGFANEVDRRAVQLLASRAYIPAPFSIYRGLFKLAPATILTLDLDAMATPLDVPPADRMTQYWDYRQVVTDGAADPIHDRSEAVARLGAALDTAIDGQAVADVPVGAFLSGGIDSSAVVAAYHRRFPGQVKTFTIGFEEDGYDEAGYARAVATHFGTEHHEHRVSVAEAQAVIPSLPTMYDEPFADSSQIPTHLVSRLARAHVTVALSGDGGDELFGGYNRYRATERLWRNLDRLPRPARRAAGAALHAVPPALWNTLIGLAPAGRRPAHFGHRLRKYFATMRDADGFDDVMASFLDEWADGSPVGGGELPRTAGFDGRLPAADPVAQMMYADAVSYLPDDILCKVDRAAMAVSLETRVPLLDHRLAELAARIPPPLRIDGGTGKVVLRDLLYGQAPKALFDRPKAGFAVPVGEWLRGDLRDWAEDLLSPRSLANGGYFDPAVVGARWAGHVSGKRDATQAIWSVLMFQSWLREQAAG